MTAAQTTTQSCHEEASQEVEVAAQAGAPNSTASSQRRICTLNLCCKEGTEWLMWGSREDGVRVLVQQMDGDAGLVALEAAVGTAERVGPAPHLDVPPEPECRARTLHT